MCIKILPFWFLDNVCSALVEGSNGHSIILCIVTFTRDALHLIKKHFGHMRDSKNIHCCWLWAWPEHSLIHNIFSSWQKPYLNLANIGARCMSLHLIYDLTRILMHAMKNMYYLFKNCGKEANIWIFLTKRILFGFCRKLVVEFNINVTWNMKHEPWHIWLSKLFSTHWRFKCVAENIFYSHKSVRIYESIHQFKSMQWKVENIFAQCVATP